MKKFLLFFIIIIFVSEASAQLFFKRDDFIGTLERRWWQWHNDPSSIPSIANTEIHNGYASFTLEDAIVYGGFPSYCDAALWDGNPSVGGPYQNVHVKARIRATTDMQDGSIGWGLWYTEGNFSVSQLLWFMQSQDISGGSGENWWIADKVNGSNQSNRQITNLDGDIEQQQWHVYEVDRQAGYINMIIDGNSVLYTTSSLPNRPMAFHIWVDNIVYVNNGGSVSPSQRSWNGTNQLLIDYVQIAPAGIDYDFSEDPSGIKLLRKVPNDIYSETQPLWKDYDFTSASGGNFVFLVTGRAEYYTGESQANIDDDLRFVIDGTDYLWDSPNSFNAESEGTINKTLMFTQYVEAGTSNIEVYAETSPLLYDVTVLGSVSGSVLYDYEYNETKSGVSAELWHEIPFSTAGGEVAIYVSGSVDEDLFPFFTGNNSSYYEDTADDDIKIVIDGFDYEYQSDQSFYGNGSFGDPKSVLITEDLAAGDHTLQIYGTGTPTLYRIVIYGNAPEASLPVSLSSFTGNVLPQANYLEWVTESEIDNFGFNLYRAESSEEEPVNDLQFVKLNEQIISAAGNSSDQKKYSFEDENIKNNMYYWYQLEDIDYKGVKTKHNIVSLYRENLIPGKFILYNNYPNPFNGSTKISFYLEDDAPLQISIFNSKGQVIQKYNRKTYNRGLNSITWTGNNLTSGVYYCAVSAFHTTHTLKMLYIK
jgi:hypothetical protein